MTEPLRWWRLEVDATGKVVSCVAVERAEQNGTRWLYVQARDQKEAGRKAWNEYCKLRQRTRDAQLRAQGRCQCGRVNDRLPRIKCSFCAVRAKSYETRRRARLRGENIPRPDRRVADAARKQSEIAAAVRATVPSLVGATRLDVLLEVQSAWEDAPNNAAFTRWLTEQIKVARAKRVA